MRNYSTKELKNNFMFLLCAMSTIMMGQTGKVVSSTYNASINAGFNTSAYEAWAYQRTNSWGGVETLPFRMLKPNNYNKSGQAYPLVIMLHGRGERGTDNNFQLKWGGQKHMQAVQSGLFPGFVVFPQEPFGYWANSPNFASNGSQPSTALSQVWDLVDSLVLKYNIDPDRIIIHGLSAGGTGTWASIYNRPDLFAAALPMSTPGDKTQASKIAPTPIWLFQGEIDTNPVKSISLEMMAALRAAGAINPALTKYTEYPGVAHFTWVPAYEEADFFPFMLRQNKRNIRLLGSNPLPSGGTTALGIGAGFAAYQWYKDGLAIVGATAHRLMGVAQAGTYYVMFKRKTSSTSWVSSNSIVINATSINIAPVVNVTSPSNGSSFLSSASINFSATASDADGTIAKLDFYVDGTKIATTATSNYSFAWSSSSVGTHTLQVVATDNLGAATSSSVRNFNINNPVNISPSVTLSSSGSSFVAPATISLMATASDADGTIAQVKFYDGTTLLATVNSSPYNYSFTTSVTGIHNLTAVAVDNLGATNTSAIVAINVSSVSGIEGTGLSGEYFNNTNLAAPSVLKRTDETINFAWGSGSPLNGTVVNNNFSARWSGQIKAPVSGSYTFSLQGDDGVRLKIGNTFVINNFVYKSSTDVGSISLNAGQLYDIVLEYFEGWGDASIIMKWSYAGQTLTVVPKANLFPSTTATARMEYDASNSDNRNIEVYPNPATDEVIVTLPTMAETLSADIIDLSTGKILQTNTYPLAADKISIATDKLKNGIYLLEVNLNGYIQKQKLVIQRK